MGSPEALPRPLGAPRPAEDRSLPSSEFPPKTVFRQFDVAHILQRLSLLRRYMEGISRRKEVLHCWAFWVFLEAPKNLPSGTAFQQRLHAKLPSSSAMAESPEFGIAD